MKKILAQATVILALPFIYCQTVPDNADTDAMNQEKIKTEVMQAENNLLTALRQGDLMQGVSMHLNSPGYRNIWNGDIKTFDVLQERIKIGMEKGLKTIDYRVGSRDFNFINATIYC